MANFFEELEEILRSPMKAAEKYREKYREKITVTTPDGEEFEMRNGTYFKFQSFKLGDDYKFESDDEKDAVERLKKKQIFSIPIGDKEYTFNYNGIQAIQNGTWESYVPSEEEKASFDAFKSYPFEESRLITTDEKGNEKDWGVISYNALQALQNGKKYSSEYENEAYTLNTYRDYLESLKPKTYEDIWNEMQGALVTYAEMKTSMGHGPSLDMLSPEQLIGELNIAEIDKVYSRYYDKFLEAAATDEEIVNLENKLGAILDKFNMYVYRHPEYRDQYNESYKKITELLKKAEEKRPVVNEINARQKIKDDAFEVSQKYLKLADEAKASDKYIPQTDIGKNVKDVKYHIFDIDTLSSAEKYDAINLYFSKNLDFNYFYKTRGFFMDPVNPNDVVWTYLTSEELSIYNKTYSYNPDLAEKYLKQIEPILEVRRTEKKEKKEKEFGEEHPYLAGFKSVYNNIAYGGEAMLDNIVDVATTGKVNTYDDSSLKLREAQAMRAGGSQHMEEKHGKVAAFAYNTGFSIAENLTIALTTKGIGTAAGAGTKAISNASLAIMGMNAASNQMISIADRGGNPAQIILGGAAAGLSEVLFEKLPMDEFFKMTKGSMVKNMVKQAGKEIPGEMATEVTNIISDTVIMGQNSESQIRARQLVLEEGMTAEEATKKVFFENLDQVLQAGAAGGVSGIAMGGAKTAINDFEYNSRMNSAAKDVAGDTAKLEAVINLGNEFNDSEAKFIGELIQEGETPDTKQVRALVESVAKSSIEKDATLPNVVRTIATIEGRSSDYYTSQEAVDTANAVLKMANGTATKTDYALIERSEGARTVVLASEGTAAWEGLKASAQSYSDARIDRKASTSGIGMKKSVSEYPYDMKKVITDYIDSTNETLLEKVKKFRTDKSAKFERVNLGNVTDRESADIKALTGDDVSGYIHAINSNAFNHIEKRHGENGQHDSTMANPEDVARVEYVLENYDSVELAKKENGDIVYSNEFRDSDNGHSPLLVYSKKINGTYYAVVASAENAYKKLWVVTTYMSKNKEGITQELHDELSSLSLTSETKLASLPSTDSISKDKRTVNSKDMRDGEIYSQGKRVSFEKGERVGGNIVYNEASRRFAKKNREGYKVIQTMAKDLGMKVKFVDGLTDSSGNVLDGVITSEGIFINTQSKNPTRFAATHEFSHRMKQTGGKAWHRYQDYVLKTLKNTESNVKGKSLYDIKYEAKKGVYAENEIDEEIAADYIGELFSDVKALAEFIRESRGLAFSVRNIWYKVLDALGLSDEKKKAQRMWASAYREAMKNKDTEYEDGTVKESKSGTRVEENKNVVDLSENNELTNKIKGLQGSEKYKAIRDFILDTLQDYEIVFNDGTKAVVDKSDALHIANKSANKKTSYIAKIKEIIEKAELYAVAENVEHKKFNQFRYYKTVVRFGNEEYGIYLNVGRSKNGDGYHLYDITKKIGGIAKHKNALERVTSDLRSEIDSPTKTTLPQNEPGVKGKKSVSGTRVVDNPSVSDAETSDSSSLTTRLLEENKRLRDNIEDLYVQMNQAEGKINTKAVNDVAKSLKEKYGSKISIPTLRRELAKLYTYMSKHEVSGDEVTKRIADIAKSVIDNATETVEGGEYSELLKTIRETRIQVPEADKTSFSEGYENFRKHSMGKLKLVKEGYPLDALWSDLVSEYPYLFSEELIGSEERLERILEVREEMRPSEESIYKTDEEYENAVTELENDIMESFFDIPEGKGGNYTFFEAKYTDRFSRDKLKKRIDSDFTYLHSMLADPTDKRHIPEHLRASVAAVLDSINFETVQLDRIRDAGKEAQSPTAIKLANISGLYENIMRKAWGVEKSGDSKLLDEYLSSDLLELKESIPVDESGEFKRLQDMSTEELRVISDVLRGIHHAVTKSNQAFTEGIKTPIDEASDNVVAEMATTRGKRKGSGHKLEYGKEKGIGKAIGAIDKFMNVDMMQPWDMFHKIGGTMEKIYGENRKAFDRHIVNLKAASEAIKNAVGNLKVKKMTGKGVEVKAFELSDGSRIEVDKGQLLSLYALYKRPQGKEHILGGGIVTGRKATDGSGNKISGNTIHKVGETDLGKMFETLSKEEKRMVEDIVKFMSKECARWGNEASMKLYGYEKYGEGWYFPIKVADTTLQMWSGSENEGNLRTQSFTKKLVKNAGNAIVVEDFFDTVAGHINGMSLYNTIALPMLDMERVLNHKAEGETVRQAIDITYGKAVNRYINKWLEDVNGSKKITDDGGLTEKFFKNAKKASIGMNMRVLLQQPTSITRALLFMNSVDMMAALKATVHPKKTMKEMQNNVPIAYWKSLGFRDVGVGSSLKDAIIDNESLYDKAAMGGYGLADDATWSLLYSAVKHEVKRKNPGIEVGSDAYWEKVVDRFNYIVDRSQVVDSVFHRSQIMRNERDFVKSATMFMSEPIKQLNMYRTELEDAVKSGSGKTIAKQVTKATAVYMFSNLILALVQALPDAWREDDDKELYDENGKKIPFGEIYKKKLGEDFIDDINPLSGIPYVKDLISILQGYSMDRIEYSALSRTINAIKALDNDKIPLPTRIYNVFKNGAPIFGFAPGNLVRDFEGITKSIMRGFGDEYTEYTLTKTKWDVNNPSNESKFMKFYDRALMNGHPEDAAKIFSDYYGAENNDAMKAWCEESARLYKATKDDKHFYNAPGDKFKFNGQEIELSDKQYDSYIKQVNKDYIDLVGKLIKSDYYKKLPDAEKAKELGDLKEWVVFNTRMKYYPVDLFDNEKSDAVLGEMDKLFINTGQAVMSKMPKDSFKANGESVNLNDEEYRKYVDNSYDTLWNMAYEFVKSEEYSTLSNEEKLKGFQDLREYSQNVEKTKYSDEFELSGWQAKVYGGEMSFLDSFEERKENREYQAERDEYKDSFEYDASKYTPEEISVIDEVESDAASYYSAVEMGREYNESDLRHIQVYDDYISDEMEIEEYAGVRAYAKKTAAMADGNESMKKDELKAYLDSTDYSPAMKAALFEAIGNKGWKNPYTGGKIGDGVHYPKVED